MKIILLFCVGFLWAEAQLTNRGTYKFEFKTGTAKVSTRNSNPATGQKYFNGNERSEKRVLPPYAVPMDPLVHYSQPDPLFLTDKNFTDARNNLIRKSFGLDSSNSETVLSPKSDVVSPYDDVDAGTSDEGYQPHHEASYPAYHDPEPIIEIIIKESNQSLPAPPTPAPAPKKKKKEHVQVFFVKYRKDPDSHYGEDKLIYESPVPAITPPTNTEDPHQHEYEEASAGHYEEPVTHGPPRPSTTLKAIIKPDSEVYHGSGGLHITFGGPKHQEDDYSPHQQSAPQPSVVFPHKGAVVSRASTESQPIKRNPEPFLPSSTSNPQHSYHNSVRPTHSPFASGRDFHRPTPPPTYQQVPQFPAQSFKSQYSQPFRSSHIHQSQPTVQRPQPTQTYSTLPQNLQYRPQPGHHHFGSSRAPPVQSTSQQYHTINHQHIRHNFQSSVRPTQSQQYHTINHHTPSPSTNYRPVTQSLNRFPAPSTPAPSSPFLNRNPPNHQRPFESRPQVGYSEHLQHQSQPQSTRFTHGQQQQPQVQVHSSLQTSQFQNPISSPSQQPRPQIHQQQLGHQQLQQQHQINAQQLQQQQQHQQKVEQLNRLQFQHQQYQQKQQQGLQKQQKTNYNSNTETEIIKSISPEIPFSTIGGQTSQPTYVPAGNPGVQYSTPKPHYTTQQQHYSTQKPQYQQTTPTFKYTHTSTVRPYTSTTEPPIEYITQDPKKLEEERRKKEERRKQNVAALPAEVPDDLRQQLLSSGILGNADIQILDYDKIGDIPIENLPPEALANFRQVAGSNPVPSIIKPDREPDDVVASASETEVVSIAKPGDDKMEMKVVRFNPNSDEGSNVASAYMREDATQLDPVVLNDSKYNRYLPLKVAGAQFPVPDVPELRGRNVTSVVVLAPVDYEFLQRKENVTDSTSRSSVPVLEVQGVHFVAGDSLKTLVKAPTKDNFKNWLDKENKTSVDKQSVVLLVFEALGEPSPNGKDIFMYDIGTQRVNKLRGELSSTFVEVAESNSQNEDLEEISDDPSVPGGNFAVADSSALPSTSGVARTQRNVDSSR